MSRPTATGSGSDQVADVSGFGGHPLTTPSVELGAPDDANGLTSSLSSIGLEDAEQVVAVASVPGVSKELQSALGLDRKAFQALLEGARSALPAERAALVSQPAPRDLGLGVRPPSAEMIAAAEATVQDGYAVEVDATAVALPTSINLISYMPPIRNQAARGTCVAFALTALNEYVLRRRGLVRNLSEQHLYYEIKLIDGDPDECGTWQAKGVMVLRDRGQCREVLWPYNPNLPCNNHGARPANARPDGLNYRLTTFAVATRSVAAYKTELARQRPVTLSIPVYDSWHQSNEVRRSGRITMRVGNEQSSGGHAVCLVGFQDSANSPGGGYFILRNSWDPTRWAYQSPYGAGYGTIPYQYITDDAWEAFSAVVPQPTEDDLVEDPRDDTATTTSSVVIEVGHNVKISIDTR
jgi:Papain family cysteine protease